MVTKQTLTMKKWEIQKYLESYKINVKFYQKRETK